jgi:DNA adenine methylase
MRLSMLDAFRWRLMRVQIDCVDALKCIKYLDNPRAVFYVDPPYVPDTRVRGSRNVYKHEADLAHHE